MIIKIGRKMANCKINRCFYLGYFFLLSFCFSGYFSIAQADTDIIHLKNRTPEELLPILSPFVEKGGIIHSFQNQIILQASAENLAQIKKMLLELDKPAEKLLLSVSQAKNAPREQFSVDIHGNVLFGQEAFSLNGQISSTNQSTRQENQNFNHIQVLSGHTATILSGKTVALINNRGALQNQGTANLTQTQNNQSQNYTIPSDNPATIANTSIPSLNTNLITIALPPVAGAAPLPSSDVTLQPLVGGNVTLGNSTSHNSTTAGSQYHTGAYQEQYLYNNLQSGAVITPTLLGNNQVKLDIVLQNEVPVENQDNNLNTNTVTKAMQKTHTVLQVPLGEWIYIGGNQIDQTQQSLSTSLRTENREASNMSLWLRVDKIGD